MNHIKILLNITTLRAERNVITSLKLQKFLMIWIVLLAALLHSHIYWFYSILYTVYSNTLENNQNIKPRKIKSRIAHVVQRTAAQYIQTKTLIKPNKAERQLVNNTSCPNVKKSHHLISFIRSFISRIQQKIQLRQLPSKKHDQNNTDRQTSPSVRAVAKSYSPNGGKKNRARSVFDSLYIYSKQYIIKDK